MLFNSWQFIAFFTIAYTLYWVLRTRSRQNNLLLLASYLFYGAWDWRFLSLIWISTVVDFFAGRKIGDSDNPRTRKIALAASVVVNLGFLGFFKYHNFFMENLDGLLHEFGTSVHGLRLHVVLPVGISFYTFQTMSYTIDIYRKQLRPTSSFRDFALFVAFFPQLVAGPIERATHLLPQIQSDRTIRFQDIRVGLWLMSWGLWKKVVIADNMARLVDPVFAESATTTAFGAYLAVLAFAAQIYCDFSGYTDVARGCARLMGFNFMLNFNLPYFAQNPSDFWRRWHISLSTWLRDYLYIPLGGNRYGTLANYRNLFLTMLLGGLWHGASWNYVWWGIYHGVILAGHRLLTRDIGVVPRVQSRWSGLVNMCIMFQFTLFGWLLFRSTRRLSVGQWGVDDSWNQITEMLTSYRNGLGFDSGSWATLATIFGFTLPLIVIQIAQYRSRDLLSMLRWPTVARVPLMAILVLAWLLWGVQGGSAFIYFQF